VQSLIRLIAPLVVVVVLVPVQGASAANKPNWHLGDRTLKEGHKGHDVRVLQDFLARAGQRVSVDGIFGAGTTSALRGFELAQRRPVDGKLTRSDVPVLRDVATNGGAIASAANTGGALPRGSLTVPAPAPALQTAPGTQATIGPDGLAIAPAQAPPVVKAIIAAGNEIATKPYVYGGGHRSWQDSGYDCSGSVSYALHGAGLLDRSMASAGFMSWADPGPGQWVTTYAHGGHMYMIVAGLRFDTSGRAGAGTRWQTELRSANGYTIRHPPGL